MLFLQVLNIVLLTFLAIFLIWFAYLHFKRKRVAKVLSSEEFKEDLRRTQLIDVREASEFKEAHILGARNIPFSQFKMRYKELRQDVPVRLYGDGVALPTRAAIQLHKSGYRDITILDGGFQSWTGHTKKAKSN